MSFVDSALKTSAIVCMTAVTITMSVATAGGIIYGPKIATSLVEASDGITKASYASRSLMLDASESIRIMNFHLGEACRAANVSMKSISEILYEIDVKMTDPEDEDREKIMRLVESVARAIDVVSNKVSDLKGVNAQEINKTVNEVNGAVRILSRGIDSFFKECKDGTERELNRKVLCNCIATLLGIFGGASQPSSKQVVQTTPVISTDQDVQSIQTSSDSTGQY